MQDCRSEFPILTESIRGHRLVYLDNAATTQKPISVLQAMNDYYCHRNANIHRSAHTLSERATAAYELARNKVQRFIKAPTEKNIIFTRGTTEAINLVAQSYARPRLTKGSEIVISQMEHHANIVPWQLVCEATGAQLKVIPINVQGELLLDSFEALLSDKTVLVALAHASNVLGTVNPAQEIIRLAHAKNIPVLLDGAQAVPHFSVDVQALDCDFYVFSGHKMYGPTGIGVLYGKEALLESMPPYHGGGNMIASVSFEKTYYNVLPHKFEAGTASIAEAVGLGAAIDWIEKIGYAELEYHETDLMRYAEKALLELPELRVIGNSAQKAPVISFTLGTIHPHDVATVLDNEGIAVRAGHHCAMPLMQFYQVPATVRVSFAMYNTHEDINALVVGLCNAKKLLSE